MKVSFDLNKRNVESKSSPSFEGYRFTKSDNGFREFEVSYPYDPNRDNCFLEIYKVDKDQYGNYFTTKKAYTKNKQGLYQLQPGSNKIDLSKEFGIADNQPFAYHYVIQHIDGSGQYVKIDAGDVIDEGKGEYNIRKIYNIVMPNRSDVSRGGSMKLVIIDSQNVGTVYNDENQIIEDSALKNRSLKGVKTLNNKFGGTLAGLEKAVEEGEYDGYDKIISLPIFTDDDFSAHAYWNKNCFQMASSLGNVNNFASLQRKMFAHGLNFVSDGAYVNEGLQGVHFKSIEKWGKDSPFKYWFKTPGLKDGPLNLGLFVKNSDFTSHKIVNSPYTYFDGGNGKIDYHENPDYDKTKPTYIQYFDTRLVTDEEKNDHKKLIKAYSILNTDNPYELHDFNDSIYPYSFEINPAEYHTNVKNLNDYNNINIGNEVARLESPTGTRIVSKFTHFNIDGTFEGGFETWDANPDIAKLSFAFSSTDSKNLKNLDRIEKNLEEARIRQGNYQVQDYAIESGKFWTQKTDDILRLYVAQTLKNVDPENPALTYKNIMSLSDNKTLPLATKAKVSQAEVENVLYETYNNKRQLSQGDKKSQILEGLMNLPLDSIEFGDNIVSVLSSPLVSKRAVVPEEVGVSRYELYKQGNPNLLSEYKETYEKMDGIYKNEMSDYAQKVLNIIDEKQPENKKLFNGEQVTEYGKYVLPLLTSEIAKYAIIKSLTAENIKTTVNPENGEIAYDYKKLKDTHLQTLKITNPGSPRDEADMLLSKMSKGMKILDDSENSLIVKSMLATLKDTSLESFRLADLIIDKNQAGLDWRIDATKDIADVESLRCGGTKFEDTWNTIIDFWKNFAQGILSKNPNSYLVAEVTDQVDLHKMGYGRMSKRFTDFESILTKFKRETGITAIADYSFFFSRVSNLFSKSFEKGTKIGDKDYPQKVLHELMVGGDNQSPLVRSGALDSLIYAYTFIGNHDKPRALHCAAMDMELFYSDISKPTSKNAWKNRCRAFKILEDRSMNNFTNEEVAHYDFSAVSPKAIAMAESLRHGFMEVLNNFKKSGNFSSEEDFRIRAFEPISKSIADLAKGKFLDKPFNPEAFGSKPFDVNIAMVIKQAKAMHGLDLPENLEKDLENKTFEQIMEPAIKKLKGMMKYLVALPGLPTLFDGDDSGASGYDTKTKNMFLQGRQRIHDEWFVDEKNPKYKKFIADHRKDFDEIMSIRKNPQCEALNNGAIYPLKMQYSQGNKYKLPAIFRQGPDGSMAISIFNTTHLSPDDHTYVYEPETVYIDRIYLNQTAEHEGIAGIADNTQFYNIDTNDKGRYFVKVDGDKHYITRVYGNKDVATPISDSTLILASIPPAEKKQETQNANVPFQGRFIPSFAQIVGTYSNKPADCGKKLSLAEV
ncbi:MAG: hypothetical protein NC191_07475 [Muribaculaceae bacterium]|nr:hypothetical protein [Muribaculaceae bacterium]